jgi:hypothetical protein
MIGLAVALRYSYMLVYREISVDVLWAKNIKQRTRLKEKFEKGKE